MSAVIERSCPVCDGRQARPHWRKGELALVRCVACGMVFANPVPAAMASGEHYEGLVDGLYLSPDKLKADYAAVRFERELKLFREFCPAGRVLDVGCSTGGFLHQLEVIEPNRYQRLGMDVVGPALDHAERSGVPVRRGRFLDFEDEAQFDAITFWAVVEHLVDPAAFLKKACAMLRPGGHCFVLVPNLKSLAIRLLGSRYRYVMPEHVNYFTSATLRRLCARVEGLEVVALRSTHFNPVVIWQDWRGRGQGVRDADRVALLKRTTAWKQRGGLMRGCYRAVEGLLSSAQLADNLVLVARRT
jgi:2-polyprenyl-3-methyl-5-hydroxy-6-metoxy-1,4-benzoquinol methylase